MKPFLLLTTLTFLPFYASADCELTPDGRAAYKQLSLEGCEMDFCVRFQTKSGRSGLERLKPAGCNASNNMPTCYSVSPSFTQVFMNDSVTDTQYLGSRDGAKVFLICRFPR